MPKPKLIIAVLKKFLINSYENRNITLKREKGAKFNFYRGTSDGIFTCEQLIFINVSESRNLFSFDE